MRFPSVFNGLRISSWNREIPVNITPLLGDRSDFTECSQVFSDMALQTFSLWSGRIDTEAQAIEGIQFYCSTTYFRGPPSASLQDDRGDGTVLESYCGEVTQLILCGCAVATEGARALVKSAWFTVVEGNQGGANPGREINLLSKYVFCVFMLAEKMFP